MGRSALAATTMLAASLAGCVDLEAPDQADAVGLAAARPFVIACWNLEYFGSPAEHLHQPFDAALQRDNAATVIGRLQPDVIGLEEIVSDERFAELEGALPAYEGLTSFDPRVEDHALYGAIPYRLAILFRADRARLLRARLVHDVDRGRPPLEATFAVGDDELTVIVVHLYPIDPNDPGPTWFRRKVSADRLKAYLDTAHPSDKVAVVGDWNDDVDVSIVEPLVEGIPTPWATPFAQLRDDRARYRFTTDGLSVAHQGTTVAYRSTIDHHLTTNELAARFVPHSAWVERPAYIPRYRETTSDHYPVITRYTLP
jgi:hypothetical protein